MQGNLLSDTRTAIVKAPQPIEMRERPSLRRAGCCGARRPAWSGGSAQCGDGWCRFDVKGQAGYVEVGGLWGVEPGETLP